MITMASPDDGVVLGARRENRGRELCTGMKNVSEETMMDELAQPLSVEHEHECAMGKLQDDNMSEIVDESEKALLHAPLKECQAETAESVTPEPPTTSKSRSSDTNIVSSSDKEGNVDMDESPLESSAVNADDTTSPDVLLPMDGHSPTSLPRFRDTNTCMWTASHAANAPSEDRSSSLVNVLLRPRNESSHSLIRVSLWSVMDGHGGGSVATYASEVLLPHIAASLSRSLECEIVQRGECRVNGELRDASAIDFEGLVQSSGKSRSNPNSIHYSTPEENDEDGANDSEMQSSSGDENVGGKTDVSDPDEFAKTAAKTAPSPTGRDGRTGTHSKDEVARVTKAVTDSFCAVDEQWINNIDVMTTRQTSPQTNGAWNAGACALVVFTVQRLDWTSNPAADRADQEPGTTTGQDTSRNRDAATESASSEPELTEMEDEGDEPRRENVNSQKRRTGQSKNEHLSQESLISTPGGCGCHFYRPQAAMLYTAHVGDCRATLLGNALPKTTKVPPDDQGHVKDQTDMSDEDDSSIHSSDETELLSSSDPDADSSSSDDEPGYHQNAGLAKTPPHMRYMIRPARRMRITREMSRKKPFVPLPPLNDEFTFSSDEEDDLQPARKVSRKDHAKGGQGNAAVSSSDEDTKSQRPILYLPRSARHMNLTTDHSAYNEAEVRAVKRRCNNAPKAISTGFTGGIKRVAGSLAVTRALGDAYLKTPLLSFNPYKRSAPYITARPEVNCRLLPTDGDEKTNNVLVIATDGVWERSSGEDVVRWLRNYSAESIAEAERKSNQAEGSNIPSEVLSPEGKQSQNAAAPKKRKLPRSRGGSSKNAGPKSNAAEVVVRRVLNKVARSRKMSTRDLRALPKGRARRSKHDDITVSVVDLRAFVS